MEETLLAMRKWFAEKCLCPMGDFIYPHIEWLHPDYVTVARIPLAAIIVTVIWIFWPEPPLFWLIVAESAFILACISDMVDGWLARKKGLDKMLAPLYPDRQVTLFYRPIMTSTAKYSANWTNSSQEMKSSYRRKGAVTLT